MLEKGSAAPDLRSGTRPGMESQTPFLTPARPSLQDFARVDWLHPDPLADDDAFAEPTLYRARINPAWPSPRLFDGGTLPPVIIDIFEHAVGRHDFATVFPPGLQHLGEPLTFSIMRIETLEALLAPFYGVKPGPMMWRGKR